MRNLFALLAVFGVVGIVMGVLTLLNAPHGQYGRLGFAYENYGGPGSIIGGLTLLAASLCVRALWPNRD